MKAITLWPEWAWAIARLDKRIENRGWVPPRGALVPGDWLAIHAGANIGGRPGRKATNDGIYTLVEAAYAVGWQSVGVEMPTGPMLTRFRRSEEDVEVFVECSAIVAVAKYQDAFRAPLEPQRCRPWQAPSQAGYPCFGWLLTDVVTLPDPVPCKGKQGLWDVPAELLPILNVAIGATS